MLKSLARRAVARVGRVRPGDADAPRILCYHGVADDPEDEWSVSTEQLGRQAARLAGSATPVPLARVAAWVAGEGELPPRAVAVTFDDGYLDVLDRAAPILAARGIPATAFVSPRFLADGGRSADPAWRALRPLMTWRDARTLLAAGWTIGSHGLTHAVLTRLPDGPARDELWDSRRELEDALGVAVEFLAYPFGTPGTVGLREHRLASEAGYRAAFVAVTGRPGRGRDRFAIPRCKVLGTDPDDVVGDILAGRMDLWGMVERRH